jgi:hypothetical protein
MFFGILGGYAATPHPLIERVRRIGGQAGELALVLLPGAMRRETTSRSRLNPSGPLSTDVVTMLEPPTSQKRDVGHPGLTLP